MSLAGPPCRQKHLQNGQTNACYTIEEVLRGESLENEMFLRSTEWTGKTDSTPETAVIKTSSTSDPRSPIAYLG
jgi:hypothetical protein